MRLTLRTLLAYLDEILDPDDAEQLAAKIRESDFAGGLVHRIRNVVGRSRLSSPQVVGKGLGADANSVAEYLDNELPSERVPDFEKVCLESDIHLAEVAASHQILTLVLGEPATFAPELRGRIYGLALPQSSTARPSFQPGEPSVHRRIDAAVTTEQLIAPETVDRSPAGAADQAAARGVTPAGNRAWLVLGAMSGLAATVAILLWPREPETTGTATRSAAIVPGGRTAAEPPAGDERLLTAPHESSPTSVDPVMEGNAASAYTLPPRPPIEPPSARSIPAEDAAVTNGREATPPPADGGGSAIEIGSDPKQDDTFEVAPAPSDSLAAVDSHSGSMPVDEPSPEHVPEAAADESRPAIEPPVKDSESATAQVLGERQVLGVWQPDSKLWRRSNPQEILVPGTRLRSLPTFRPQVLIDQQLDLSLMGVAELIAGGATSPWELNEGGFSIARLGAQAKPLALRAGGRDFLLALDDADSLVVLEVKNLSPLGSDPSEAQFIPHVRCWVINGHATIALADGVRQVMEAGQRWTFVGSEAPQMGMEHAPDWVSMSSVREIDRQAAMVLESRLIAGQPLEVALQHASQDRRTDVRSVAARCLASLGDFGPLVESFSDPRFHAAWPDHFAQLRESVQRSRVEADGIRKALKSSYGQDAEGLFKMLWGFSSRQLRTGDAERLVKALENRDLPVRVFAVENLREITGFAGYFRPDYHANRRKEAIRGWKRRLEAGEIRHTLPPENDLPVN